MNNQSLSKITNTLKLDEKIDYKSDMYNRIMFIYSSAIKVFETKLQIIKDEYNLIYNYNLIDHINTRVKMDKSIINKMKRKNINLTYGDMIEQINDIAGIRIICPMKNDIYTIRNIIEKFPDTNILEEKDYITNPKKSGYESYHMIINVPITFLEDTLFIKIEIQIRTITMDYWSQVEHRKRYKAEEELTKSEKKSLIECAKLINKLDNKMMSLNPVKNIF